MKLFYFILALLTLSVHSYAQTEGASKLYGYKQEVMPGTVRVDDNGNQIPRAKRFNYFIYLASGSKVQPVEIWLNGEVYSVNATMVASTPVEYIHPTSGDTTPVLLVPKTTRHVLQLSSSVIKPGKCNQKGKLLSRKNELVVIYKANDKLYYKAVSKLTGLTPLAMQ